MITVSNDDDDDDDLVGADDALARLMEGNSRFLRGELRFTRASLEVLADLAKEGQRPFATILGCGAVQAALAAKFEGARERSRIQLLLQNMLPGLEGIDPQLPPQQRLACAVEANVRWTMHQFLDTPEGRARMAEGQMKLVGAVCDIATGRVRLLA